MLRLLILLSSEASLYHDTFDMTSQYCRSLYRPISIPKCKQTLGLRKTVCILYALQLITLTIVHDDQ